ncbi:MAG TPA: hypothetical protein VG733_03265 [Chthoniobacteraceae bacterium]|nr:hypothetical protein [Chthoniobacteraceae bacterium]
MATPPQRARVNTLLELDALVGERIIGEVPEVYWEDAHAMFRFETESEAMDALKRLRSQPSLPRVNWDSLTVSQVKSYRPYSADIAVAWSIVEKATAESGDAFQIRREGGMWRAAFGHREEILARSAPVAICVAGLRAAGIEVIFDPDGIH